jgi:predicted amidohydrolase YtcJ
MGFSWMRWVGGVAAGVAVAGAAEALLLTGGKVYTADDRRREAEAVLAIEGRIAYVGTTAEARRRAPAGTRTLDLTGRTVLPGFTDSHVHLGGVGSRELSFNLETVGSLADLQARLKARAAQTAEPQAWIVGRGWIESRWSPPVFPTRADLDAAEAKRPVVLVRADGHALVANSAALALAKIDRTTPNPPGGEILRGADGEATGVLVDNAMTLVRRLIPAETAAERAKALEIGAARELRLGWTQVQVAGASLPELEAMRDLQTPLRIYAAASGPGAAAERLIEGGPMTRGRFTARSIKLYIDGALGSRGAALLAPYADAPGNVGLTVTPPATLEPLVVRALRNGIQIQTHAIGDRGNRQVLDLYERVFGAVPAEERKVAVPRWRIEHAQVIAPADLGRFAALGVIASMQPSHAIGDLYFAPARLGKARLAGAYAWRSLLDAGALIAGGSDAPVERGEPLIEFYAAVARKALDGFSDADWHPEQRVTRWEALKMFTLWPAHAAFEDQERGSIAVGKAADFTVFSADIMTIPEPEILKAECVLTIVGGDIAWEKRG